MIAADDGCIQHFENTAAFSREYQAAQKCMCDTEHMFDCPSSRGEFSYDNDLDFEQIVRRYKVIPIILNYLHPIFVSTNFIQLIFQTFQTTQLCRFPRF